MEAAPRLPMLSCELKVSPSNTDFGPALKKYIAEHYHEDPEAYNNEIRELESLRMAACKVSRDFTGCSTLKKYYSQLLCLQSRFPMTDDGAAVVPFMWSDIYSGMVFNILDIKYEQASILYNIGALHSELGALENRNNAEGMKIACTHFQCAAWAFQQVRDNFAQPKGSDMSHDLLTFFINGILAQAQECILEKSMLDSRKASITAKVAAQVVDYYKIALKILVAGSSNMEAGCILDIVGSKLFKGWKKFLEFKMAYYHSISCLYMGNQAEEAQKMGDRQAWFQFALDKLNEAITLAKSLDREDLNEALTFTMDVIGGKFNAAQKENDFVYHEKVPPSESLPEIKGATLVKGIPFNPADPEICGPDIFARLVPIEAHEASSIYSEEKAQLLRCVTSKIEQKDDELEHFLSSLNLNRSILSMETSKLPQELIERCAALSVRPTAISDLVLAMQGLNEIYNEVDKVLREVGALISEEAEKEAQHQVAFGKRPPSNIMAELTKEFQKYEEAHHRASESNSNLQKAFSVHVANLRMLSGPLDDLEKSLPSIALLDIPNNEVVVKELNMLLDKVDEMKNQRKMLHTRLREAIQRDDITKQLVTRKEEDIQKFFAEEIKKHDQDTGLIDQNLTAQDNILRALTQSNAQFAETRKAAAEILKRRETMINSLIASYNNYEELVTKTQKGTEFYKKLQNNISRLSTRVRSVVKVQDEERMQIVEVQARKAGKGKGFGINAPVVSSSAPKLKDFLPYMTGRTGVTVAPVMPSAAVIPQSVYQPTSTFSPPASGDAQPNSTPTFVHPTPTQTSNINTSGLNVSSEQPETKQTMMGIRPTPVGSEQTKASSYSLPDSIYTSSSSPYPPHGLPVGMNYGYIHQEGYYPKASTPATIPVALNQPGSLPTSGNQPASVPVLPNQSPVVSIPSGSQSVPSSPAQTYTSYPSNLGLHSSSSGGSLSYAGTNHPNMYNVAYTYPQTTVQRTPPSTLVPGTPTTNIMQSYVNPQSATGYSSLQYSYYNSEYMPSATYHGPAYPSSTPTYSVTPASGGSFQNTRNTFAYSTSLPSPQQVPEGQRIASLPSTSTYTQVTQTRNAQQPVPSAYESVRPGFGQHPLTSSAQSPVSYAQSQVYQYYYSGQQYAAQQTPNDKNTQPASASSYYPEYAGTVPTTTTSPALSVAQTYGGSQTTQVYTDTKWTYPDSNVNYSMQQQQPGMVYGSPAVTPQQQPASYQQPSSMNQTYASNQTSYTSQAAPAVQAQVPFVPQPVPSTSPSSTPVTPSQNIAPQPIPQPKVETNSPSHKDLLSSTLENQKNGETKHPPLQPKVLTTDELKEQQLQAEEKERELRQQTKDPFLDSATLDRFISEVERFEKAVEGLTKKSLNGPTPLEQKWKDFQDAQDRESRKLSISVARCYPMKNRIPDVMPYDHNRIEIHSQRDDYINASLFKDVTANCPKYIVTQAPLPSTYADFWAMVWEQQVETLVCLVNNNELKGHIYWPLEKGSPVNHGPVTLTLQSSKEKQFYVERMINVMSNENKVSRVVVHLQLLDWPASSTQSTPSQLLQFITEVHTFHKVQRSLLRPIIVHCLGGVGRSGIFCLISSAIREICVGNGILDVLSVAILLSQNRKFIIQEKEQFKFCFDAVLYYAQDVLIKRGILTNKASFSDKPHPPMTHVRHPSEDFILGSGGFSSIQKSLANLSVSNSPNSTVQSGGNALTSVSSASQLPGTSGNAASNILTDTTSSSQQELVSRVSNAEETPSSPVNSCLHPEPKEEDSKTLPIQDDNSDVNNTMSSDTVEVSKLDEVTTEVSKDSESVEQSDSASVDSDPGRTKAPITSLLDPASFTLEPMSGSPKQKFTKDSFKSASGKLAQFPSNPNDPLSQLDPLWSLKKSKE